MERATIENHVEKVTYVESNGSVDVNKPKYNERNNTKLKKTESFTILFKACETSSGVLHSSLESRVQEGHHNT